ncbi:LOW QUALITY PROTEIN: proto-oncogene vav [Melopsittacus undulatus]|uniref:LOW QUALITY PROTEIN: proto-oncogene vav n=1 Tax=Melopsittacus undulatus TaxID=13146 RepID=UPI00146D56DE|nr:LOW QUALITY PROTEIN: proto-oncogene vav [Melopsittacus undulatus]
METWRQCAQWLVAARVLPGGHRASSSMGQVWDLAQALRDGVLLCHLLNALLPQAVPPRDICPRPQMSQFLCLRNIRTFLTACADKFGLPKHRLFGAFDLFDVLNFGKVIETLSTLSWTPIAQSKGLTPFPTGDCVGDEDIYRGLSDLIDDAAEDDDDLYDCVEAEADDGDGVYEDLMRTEPPPATKGGVDRRLCCLQELRMTEERYLESLEAICKHFLRPLRHFLQPQDLESIFINIEELLQLHRLFLGDLREALGEPGGSRGLGPLFVAYKERFLPYGRYCSQVEAATRRLEHLSCSTDLSMKLQECSQRANNGRFSLRDLLMVPMQRVLKYHLLLQELVKLSPDPGERERLRLGLDAMRDLAQCVNEVKRDNETLKQLTSIQLCLENMPQSLAQFGRPKIDGELKVSSTERRSRVERYGFLLDKALILCKRRGDSYEAKAVVDLQSHQVRDGGSGARDSKKWTHTFLLIEAGGLQAFELFFKTQELKKKWLEQFEMALSNIFPEHALADGHEFQMFSFEDTASCRACQMLLRGTFFQGYRCIRCRAPAHKECLGRVGTCGRGSNDSSSGPRKVKPQRPSPEKERGGLGLPKVEAHQPYSGVPPPPGAMGPGLRLSPGDILEVTVAEAEQLWWQGRNLATGALGWFPSAAVGPFLRVPLPDLTLYPWFAGPMERGEAEQVLASRSHGSFLVRQRGKDAAEFAISIKYHGDVKHIKVMTSEGLYWVTEKKVFKGLVELVGFYQSCSLKEAFKALDTALVLPFKEAGSRDGAQAGGPVRSFGSARARYAFSARDRTELTLREGDIVRVLSKRGHPGWWKGEVYGRVGWFPSNYVEEDYSEYC